MRILNQLPVCHYFFTHFFTWSGLSAKNFDDTALLLGDYGVFCNYREFVFKPTKPFDVELIGNYEYVATNKGDFNILFEEEGLIRIELLREIDQMIPVEGSNGMSFQAEYVPLPIDEEIYGKQTNEWKEKVDQFYAEIEEQKMTIINVDDED